MAKGEKRKKEDFGNPKKKKITREETKGVARELSNGHASSLSHLVTLARVKKPKVSAFLATPNEKVATENEFYEQVKQQRDAKLAAKAQLYPRTSVAAPSRAEAEIVDGKRPIGGQISKNRGLTRPRPKDKKNPRTNNRRKHEQSIKRRQGQVRDVKKPSGPYGGEASGINAGVSRSIRFKS